MTRHTRLLWGLVEKEEERGKNGRNRNGLAELLSHMESALRKQCEDSASVDNVEPNDGRVEKDDTSQLLEVKRVLKLTSGS